MAPQFYKLGEDKKTASPVCAELEVEGLGKFTVGQIATIGRSPESQVVLNAKSVSRNHARIFYEGGHFWIKDLDSANGTSVNGKKVNLQMLADQDKICFGDAKATFRSANHPKGPAALGKDPLAGADLDVPDGTPTGGLGAPFPARDERGTAALKDGPASVVASGGSEIQALTRKIEKLQAENELLRREIAQYRSTTSAFVPPAAGNPDKEEIDRLRSLVGRLERALADSNLRLRNLQQRMDERR